MPPIGLRLAVLAVAARVTFDFVAEDKVYVVCADTVAAAVDLKADGKPLSTRKVSVKCMGVLKHHRQMNDAQVMAAYDDCDEFAGRLKEEDEKQRLVDKDNSTQMVCTQLVQEHIKARSKPASAFAPEEENLLKLYCSSFCEKECWDDVPLMKKCHPGKSEPPSTTTTTTTTTTTATVTEAAEAASAPVGAKETEEESPTAAPVEAQEEETKSHSSRHPSRLRKRDLSPAPWGSVDEREHFGAVATFGAQEDTQPADFW
mmetsp:Transcript_59968/g.160652  ORF Transcript_59968/g.160652 Transcript_59968/m.160652 type:complete len:259 (-) Transcript_59968:57-833(-)